MPCTVLCRRVSFVLPYHVSSVLTWPMCPVWCVLSRSFLSFSFLSCHLVFSCSGCPVLTCPNRCVVTAPPCPGRYCPALSIPFLSCPSLPCTGLPRTPPFTTLHYLALLTCLALSYQGLPALPCPSLPWSLLLFPAMPCPALHCVACFALPFFSLPWNASPGLVLSCLVSWSLLELLTLCLHVTVSK